ncbi:Hypothetical predicted protein [Paramuricea clavata]|uniref:Uncharacterized protein n=1 Tax=Paramuricea clavata TaxID=317549 RepID=A0A7D9DTY2_PARCT|nr:Hypothetical predicted protein [Paramuricea clavata]
MALHEICTEECDQLIREAVQLWLDKKKTDKRKLPKRAPGFVSSHRKVFVSTGTQSDSEPMLRVDSLSVNADGSPKQIEVDLNEDPESDPDGDLAAKTVTDKAAYVDPAAGIDNAALNDTQILFLMNVSPDEYNDCIEDNDDLSANESGLSDEELEF